MNSKWFEGHFSINYMLFKSSEREMFIAVPKTWILLWITFFKQKSLDNSTKFTFNIIWKKSDSEHGISLGNFFHIKQLNINNFYSTYTSFKQLNKYGYCSIHKITIDIFYLFIYKDIYSKEINLRYHFGIVRSFERI